jgi:hypothetical protein
MTQVSVLRCLLSLVRHVNQDVKPVTVIVTVDNRQPLLFVEIQHLPNGGAKVL